MTVQRDFLERAPGVVGSTNEELLRLMSEQNDYLQDIALYLRQQSPDVLASAIVKNTDQLTNAITDNNSHEVVFQVGGKPVEIFRLLAYSNYKTDAAVTPVGLSILSMSKILDGAAVTTTPFMWDITTHTVHIMTAYVDVATHPLVVNGPADAIYGGLYLYGFTIPDWDRVRGAIRSMQ